MWKILVVEDNQEVAEFLVTYLEGTGHNVVLAQNLNSARKMLGLDKKTLGLDNLPFNPASFDLVICDLNCDADAKHKGKGGVDLALDIRQYDQNFPIILVSGFPGSLEAKEEGLFFRILSKPFRLSILQEALNVLPPFRPGRTPATEELPQDPG
jgi:CheY-like chemotaxis protein